jgi:hypothetical protein
MQLASGQPSRPPQDQERLLEGAPSAIDDDPPGIIKEERLIEETGPGIAHTEFEKRPQLAELRFDGSIIAERKAPPAITGDNVYVAWWTNETGNDEVLFRASTDGGTSFGDKINLSNTTDADSTRVEIDSDADSVIVTWWETNSTAEEPVGRISTDNGATFGPLLKLATNGTLGEASEGEGEG